jgi:serine/threonine protein phosphatase 1
MTTYAVGDVHGCVVELREMYRLIKADWESLGREGKPEIVMLGDYIDRGPNSKGVIDFLITKSETDETFDWTFLMGNHEDLMMNHPMGWIQNGGEETIKSYLGQNELYSWEMGYQWQELVGARHAAFYKRLHTKYKKDNVVFVHAGLNPHLSFESQSVRDCLWLRSEYKGEYEGGYMVVHGHTPNEKAIMLPNRVNLDSACVFGYRLTAARINTEKKEVEKLIEVKSSFSY